MSKSEDRVDIAKLLARFDVDFEAGTLRWCALEGASSAIKSWNSKNAGKVIANKNEAGYLQVHPKIDGVVYHLMVHRIIYLAKHGYWPAEQLDHESHVLGDNRLERMRDASPHENSCNKRMYKNNTSGYKGVTWFANLNRWACKLGVKGKLLHIGYFYDPREAALAYDKAALEHHGQFARTNKMLGLI